MTNRPHSGLDPDHPWLGLASYSEETRAWFHGRPVSLSPASLDGLGVLVAAPAPFAPETIAVSLPPEVEARLEGTVAGCEARDVVLAALAALVARVGATESPVIGVCVDGRRHDALGSVMGPLDASLARHLEEPHGSIDCR